MYAERLRAAVIGAGKIAELGHLPGYVAADARVVALCDRTPLHLDQLASRFNIERCCTDWRLLLSEGGFDAVSVCTPPALHRDMTVEALRHGYHVLVEKPMALTPDECQDMIDAAEASGKLLMVAHNQRFRSQHRIAKSILESGRLGQIRRVHAVFAHGGPERWSPNQKWYFDRALAGHGVMLDLGYHKLDLLRWLLGMQITYIHALTATFEKPTTAEDTAVATVIFGDRVLGTLQVSCAHHPDVPDSITIDSEKGTLFVPSDPALPVRLLEQLDGGEVIESSIRSERASDPGWIPTIHAFVDAITAGLPSPVSGAEGKAALEAVLRAYESAAQSRT